MVFLKFVSQLLFPPRCADARWRAFAYRGAATRRRGYSERQSFFTRSCNSDYCISDYMFMVRSRAPA